MLCPFWFRSVLDVNDIKDALREHYAENWEKYWNKIRRFVLGTYKNKSNKPRFCPYVCQKRRKLELDQKRVLKRMHIGVDLNQEGQNDSLTSIDMPSPDDDNNDYEFGRADTDSRDNIERDSISITDSNDDDVNDDDDNDDDKNGNSLSDEKEEEEVEMVTKMHSAHEIEEMKKRLQKQSEKQSEFPKHADSFHGTGYGTNTKLKKKKKLTDRSGKKGRNKRDRKAFFNRNNSQYRDAKIKKNAKRKSQQKKYGKAMLNDKYYGTDTESDDDKYLEKTPTQELDEKKKGKIKRQRSLSHDTFVRESGMKNTESFEDVKDEFKFKIIINGDDGGKGDSDFTENTDSMDDDMISDEESSNTLDENDVGKKDMNVQRNGKGKKMKINRKRMMGKRGNYGGRARTHGTNARKTSVETKGKGRKIDDDGGDV